MESIIELCIVFMLGWYVGSRVTAAFQLNAFKQILQDLGVKNKDLRAMARNNGLDLPEEPAAVPMTEHEIVIEKHGDELYAFRVDNNEFLGQGPDRDSLVKRIAERYSNTRFTIKEGAEHVKSEA